jgi:hypothetical protein
VSRMCWAAFAVMYRFRHHFFSALYPTRQLYGLAPVHPVWVNAKALTPKQLSSVPCPTCWVAAGKRCHEHTGALRLRNNPHFDREVAAIEAVAARKLKRN